MKILLDENLSHKLIPRLRDLFPDITSVRDVGLKQMPDVAIWRYTRNTGFLAVLTADRDFADMAVRLGPPPKIIHLENCNFSSLILEQIIRRDAIRIAEFLKSDQGLLVLRR